MVTQNTRFSNNTMAWIEKLIDKNSYSSLFDTESQEPEVFAGLAKVNGKLIAVYAHNKAVNNGFLTQKACSFIIAIQKKALEMKIPIVGFLASVGVSIEENIKSAQAYTEVMSGNVSLSGKIPQFALIISATIGGAAYSAALMDLTFFNSTRSFMMVISSTVVRNALGETASLEKLGGSTLHSTKTGLADFVDDSYDAQYARLKKIIDFFPSSCFVLPQMMKSGLPKVSPMTIPDDIRTPIDVRRFIEGIVDNSEYHEFRAQFGKAIVCAWSYLSGYPVGILANQSSYSSGALDSDASQKSARFLQLCDAYNIPILTLIDTPGFMPGSREEQKGMLRYGAQMIMAMNTTVPRISLILRRSYGGGGFLMMQTRAQGGDAVLALAKSRIALIGYEAYKQAMAEKPGIHNLSAEAYYENFESASHALKKGIIDEIITEEQVRSRLGDYLRDLYPKLEKNVGYKRFIFP